MIAYDLQCSQGHTFEGWFDDEEAFKSQQEKGLVSCPVCNDAAVIRIPSTFAIRAAGGSAGPSHGSRALAAIQQNIIAFVKDNFDDVGSDFAREALKIHYGVSEPRNIRGVSTSQEEKILQEEGIEFLKFPIPAPPDADA